MSLLGLMAALVPFGASAEALPSLRTSTSADSECADADRGYDFPLTVTERAIIADREARRAASRDYPFVAGPRRGGVEAKRLRRARRKARMQARAR